MMMSKKEDLIVEEDLTGKIIDPSMATKGSVTFPNDEVLNGAFFSAIVARCRINSWMCQDSSNPAVDASFKWENSHMVAKFALRAMMEDVETVKGLAGKGGRMVTASMFRGKRQVTLNVPKYALPHMQMRLNNAVYAYMDQVNGKVSPLPIGTRGLQEQLRFPPFVMVGGVKNFQHATETRVPIAPEPRVKAALDQLVVAAWNLLDDHKAKRAEVIALIVNTYQLELPEEMKMLIEQDRQNEAKRREAELIMKKNQEELMKKSQVTRAKKVDKNTLTPQILYDTMQMHHITKESLPELAKWERPTTDQILAAATINGLDLVAILECDLAEAQVKGKRAAAADENDMVDTDLELQYAFPESIPKTASSSSTVVIKKEMELRTD